MRDREMLGGPGGVKRESLTISGSVRLQPDLDFGSVRL